MYKHLRNNKAVIVHGHWLFVSEVITTFIGMGNKIFLLPFPFTYHALNCDFFLSFPCWSLIFSPGWFILSNMIQAYMYGFFKNKRIVLYDTLIQQVFKLFHFQYVFFILLCLELLEFFSLETRKNSRKICSLNL
jgi:hypothetical protein